MGYNGFHWVLMGFTGFHWVLLDFTGFYCFFCLKSKEHPDRILEIRDPIGWCAVTSIYEPLTRIPFFFFKLISKGVERTGHTQKKRKKKKKRKKEGKKNERRAAHLSLTHTAEGTNRHRSTPLNFLRSIPNRVDAGRSLASASAASLGFRPASPADRNRLASIEPLIDAPPFITPIVAAAATH